MHRRVCGTLAAAAMLVATAAPAAAQSGDPEAQTIVRNCFTCHGSDGKGNPPMLPIQGLKVEQIVTALEDFRSGRRSATIMSRIVKGYSADQVKAIAEYLAGLQ